MGLADCARSTLAVRSSWSQSLVARHGCRDLVTGTWVEVVYKSSVFRKRMRVSVEVDENEA